MASPALDSTAELLQTPTVLDIRSCSKCGRKLRSDNQSGVCCSCRYGWYAKRPDSRRCVRCDGRLRGDPTKILCTRCVPSRNQPRIVATAGPDEFCSAHAERAGVQVPAFRSGLGLCLACWSGKQLAVRPGRRDQLALDSQAIRDDIWRTGGLMSAVATDGCDYRVHVCK